MAEMNAAALSMWTCDNVAEWLNQQGFGQYADLLCSEHRIDGPALLMLTEDDLKQEPIKMTILGDIKRLMSKLRQLKAQGQDLRLDSISVNNNVNVPKADNTSQNSQWATTRHSRVEYPSADVLTQCQQLTAMNPALQYHQTLFPQESRRLDPELWKTLLSFVYVFAVFLLTAFVMVIVHDRVPDMQTHPPLPDIFLDNMPHVPWAFEASELVGLILNCIWVGVLLFHKHRFILMRRMFSLMGTIFLLRCVTMLITSLSVPGRHLHCVGKRYGDIWSRLQRALDIWQGFGMTLQGVKSCGDYMFSGHTTIITLLNFFITEYTPAKDWYYLHVTSWVLNIFGIFFILAAHEHYSIDVFIAFYITSRLFMYYHTLANNRSLMQQDARRTRLRFPLFSFFESKCDGIVPNEYEWPFCVPQCIKDFLRWEGWTTSSKRGKTT
ncbi:sphingomyelin synthase-related protein 1-like isoform X2 [Babylonia areolata]